jgi:hypothetical protein
MACGAIATLSTVFDEAVTLDRGRRWWGLKDTIMTREQTDTRRLAQEKRAAAARARRLAQTFVGPDREQLLEFATDLDKEAEAFETGQISISLPPVVEQEAKHQVGFQRPRSDQTSRRLEKNQ